MLKEGAELDGSNQEFQKKMGDMNLIMLPSSEQITVQESLLYFLMRFQMVKLLILLIKTENVLKTVLKVKMNCNRFGVSTEQSLT
ncbi:MAG: hypothetical protein MR749_03250 [Succinatimonas hippei]|nr:hypothetical protein [Succinatimonas hippei]